MDFQQRTTVSGSVFMARTLTLLVLGSALGVLGALVYFELTASPSTDAGETSAEDSAGQPQRRSIMALGTLEPRDGTVELTSALVGYPIKQVLVKDGQSVNPGDVTIELDGAAAETELQMALAQKAEALEKQQTEISMAKERVASAQLAVEQAKAGRPLEIDAQKSRISVALLKEAQARKDAEYLKQLRTLSEPLASQQQVEHQQVILEAATAEYDASQVALKRLEQTLTFQQQTVEAELRSAQLSLQLAAKGTGLDSLERRIDLAKLKLSQTKIVSPSAGVVLNILAHPGEVVGQQPLVQIANLEQMVCVAEIDAADVAHLQPQHPAVIKCRAFADGTLTGTVERIGNLVTTSNLRPLDPRKPVDRNVVKAIVKIDSNHAARLMSVASDRRSALVGLQVEIEFPLKSVQK